MYTISVCAHFACASRAATSRERSRGGLGVNYRNFELKFTSFYACGQPRPCPPSCARVFASRRERQQQPTQKPKPRTVWPHGATRAYDAHIHAHDHDETTEGGRGWRETLLWTGPLGRGGAFSCSFLRGEECPHVRVRCVCVTVSGCEAAALASRWRKWREVGLEPWRLAIHTA